MKNKNMNLKQLTLVAILNVSFITPAMEVSTPENHFDLLPSDLLLPILTQEKHRYPWQKFKYVRQFACICKSWYNTVSNTDVIARMLTIPPMHCAAMMNEPEKIIELKLAGHSPCAPDEQGC